VLSTLFRQIDTHLECNPVKTAIEVFLGDYVDRGPASREVLEQLLNRTAKCGTICLRGNHEALLLEFLQDPETYRTWSNVGGDRTLISYGLVPKRRMSRGELEALSVGLLQAMPATHLEFLNRLPFNYMCGDYFFVHAGVRPGIPLILQNPYDMMCIREEFLRSKADFGKMVVHGHTPVMEPEILENRINIDTGAYATGRLTCLVIDEQGMAVLGEDSER
jgi:serine/threonine protein phosphatase 1